MRLSVRNKILISHLLVSLPLALFLLYDLSNDAANSTINTAHVSYQLLFLLPGIIITMLISMKSRAVITRPLSQLNKYVENISNPNREDDITIKSGDEFEHFFDKLTHINNRLQTNTKNFDTKNKELEVIISNMQSGVIISDKDAKIVSINKKAKEFFGWCPCLGKDSQMCLKYLRKTTGGLLSKIESPVLKALEKGIYSNYVIEALKPKTRKKAILNFNGAQILDQDGNVTGSVLIFLDVTKQYTLQQKQSRLINFEKIKTSHLSVLHKVSLLLNQEQNVDAILDIVIEAAVEITKARSGMVLKKDKRSSLPIKNLNINCKCTEDNESPVCNAITNIAQKNFSKYRDEFKPREPNCPARNMLLAPIKDRNQKTTYVLAVINKSKRKRFTLEDEKVVQILCTHASVAIRNAKNYEREHHISQVLQKSLLPPKSFAKNLSPEIDISLTYKPATKGTMVGGDFYDFIDLGNNKTACLIADVNGKGVEAATTTSLVKNTIKAFAYEGYSPDTVLEKTNKALHNQTDDSVFITATYGILDLNNYLFIYANAGHPPPLLYSYLENCVTVLNQGSTPLSLLPNERYQLHTANLNIHDSLVLYTDGLIEVRSDGKFFGEKGLKKSILTHAPMSVNTAEKILGDVEKFSGGDLHDDIALLVLKIKEKKIGKLRRVKIDSNLEFSEQ